MFRLWCGKPKAIIWAMLLTGFYKGTQKHLHYMCPNRKHLIYPFVCFVCSYLMPAVLEIWSELSIGTFVITEVNLIGEN